MVPLQLWAIHGGKKHASNNLQRQHGWQALKADLHPQAIVAYDWQERGKSFLCCLERIEKDREMGEGECYGGEMKEGKKEDIRRKSEFPSILSLTSQENPFLLSHKS